MQPSLAHLVVPITAVIIVVLFATQRIGSAAVGRLFGPVMIVWFLAIGACGVSGIADHPAILKALSPTYALGFLAGHFATAFFSLAAVVLAITGAEALYADMGHFGRAPITRAWLAARVPGLHPRATWARARSCSRTRARGQRARSSCSSRTGAGCRWCCSRPRRR